MHLNFQDDLSQQRVSASQIPSLNDEQLMIIKSLLSSRISKFNGLFAICILVMNTSGVPVIAADKNSELQAEIAKREISIEDANGAMSSMFPNSDFPYYEPVNEMVVAIPFLDLGERTDYLKKIVTITIDATRHLEKRNLIVTKHCGKTY